jgi:hypothetical protein
MQARWDREFDDDPLLEAVRALRRLDITPVESDRIAGRAIAELRRSVSPRWMVARLTAIVARPLVSLSLAGFLVSYVLWAIRQVADLYR